MRRCARRRPSQSNANATASEDVGARDVPSDGTRDAWDGADATTRTTTRRGRRRARRRRGWVRFQSTVGARRDDDDEIEDERGDECATTTRAWTRYGVEGGSGDNVRDVVDVGDGVGERRDVDRRRRVLSGERVRRGDERVRAGDGERDGDV